MARKTTAFPVPHRLSSPDRPAGAGVRETRSPVWGLWLLRAPWRVLEGSGERARVCTCWGLLSG